MKELDQLHRRAAQIAALSAEAFDVARSARPTPMTLEAAQRVIEFHSRGRVYLPKTLALAREVAGAK